MLVNWYPHRVVIMMPVFFSWRQEGNQCMNASPYLGCIPDMPHVLGGHSVFDGTVKELLSIVQN